MSSDISFFTPVYRSNSSTMQGLVEGYFHLSGETAYVVDQVEQADLGVVVFHEKGSLFMTALKIASYFTLFVPILMLVAKAVLRSSHRYHIIDVKQQLEEGMEITPETIKKIETLIPKIIEGENDPDLIWHVNHGTFFNIRTFSLASMPNRIFKVPPPTWSIFREKTTITSKQMIEESFENALKGKKICLLYNLSQLIIPHQKVFEMDIQGQRMPVLMQEQIGIENSVGDTEELYYISTLSRAISQLTTFITKTGFSSVTYETIPIIAERENFPGDRRVALVNLEEMDNAAQGLAKLQQLGLVN